MKRERLLKILGKYGCVLYREGARHSIFFNPKTERGSAIPRHNEIDEYLVKKIYKQLGIEVE